MVEDLWYPGDPPGRDPPALNRYRDAIGSTGIVILVNLAALALLLVPGVNAVASSSATDTCSAANSSRRRRVAISVARKLAQRRQAYQGKVFVGGLLIALLPGGAET